MGEARGAFVGRLLSLVGGQDEGGVLQTLKRRTTGTDVGEEEGEEGRDAVTWVLWGRLRQVQLRWGKVVRMCCVSCR